MSQSLLASHTKAVLALNGSLGLTSTRSSRIHLESSWSLARSGGSFESEHEGHLSTHTCHGHGQDSSGGHLCASRHVLVDLASIGRLKQQQQQQPFDPVPSLSLALCVRSPSWEHLARSVRVPEISGLGALLRLRRATVWSEVNKVEWKWKSLSTARERNADTMSPRVNQSYKDGPLHPCGYSSQNGSIIFILQFKMHWYSFDINIISQGGV